MECHTIATRRRELPVPEGVGRRGFVKERPESREGGLEWMKEESETWNEAAMKLEALRLRWKTQDRVANTPYSAQNMEGFRWSQSKLVPYEENSDLTLDYLDYVVPEEGFFHGDGSTACPGSSMREIDFHLPVLKGGELLEVGESSFPSKEETLRYQILFQEAANAHYSRDYLRAMKAWFEAYLTLSEACLTDIASCMPHLETPRDHILALISNWRASIHEVTSGGSHASRKLWRHIDDGLMKLGYGLHCGLDDTELLGIGMISDAYRALFMHEMNARAEKATDLVLQRKKSRRDVGKKLRKAREKGVALHVRKHHASEKQYDAGQQHRILARGLTRTPPPPPPSPPMPLTPYRASSPPVTIAYDHSKSSFHRNRPGPLPYKDLLDPIDVVQSQHPEKAPGGVFLPLLVPQHGVPLQHHGRHPIAKSSSGFGLTGTLKCVRTEHGLARGMPHLHPKDVVDKFY